jgi:AmpE protein
LKFLALIIALGLLQYWGSAGPVHRDQWVKKWFGSIRASGLMTELQLAAAVLLPMLLMFWVQDLVSGWLFGLLGVALMVLVLLYSFGRGDFEALVGRYRGYCQQGDFEAAFLFLDENMSRPGDEACPNNPENLHRWAKEQIGYRGFERWFGVIFYFALFGAAGALAYRLLQLYCAASEADDDERKMLAQILFWADWLPVRLLVFAFAVTGDWVGSREQLMRSLQDTTTPAARVISDGAHAALGLKTTVFSADNGDTQAFAEVGDWEIGQLQGLLSRSAVAWVVVLSIFVLFV